MIKKTDGFIPKLIKLLKRKPEDEKYPLQKDVYNYRFDEKDVEIMNKMKKVSDAIAYKQDLILKGKMKIEKKN